jgi:hypothetical protein
MGITPNRRRVTAPEAPPAPPAPAEATETLLNSHSREELHKIVEAQSRMIHELRLAINEANTHRAKLIDAIAAITAKLA